MRTDSDLLSLLAQRAQDALARDDGAKAFLRQNGIANAAVLAAYRLGALGKPVLDALPPAAISRLIELGLHRSRLASPLTKGILIPTCDPREPERVTGLVKLMPAQNKHAFLTEPRGLACTADVNAHARIVLADAPLLALRLAQAGVLGVCLAEDAAMLPPLADWLKGKEILTVSHKREGLSKLDAPLAALGIKARGLLIHVHPERVSPEAWRILGVAPPMKRAAPNPAPISTKGLADLLAYARARVQAGEGAALLTEAGIADPAFVETFQVGFLPPDFRSALPREQRGIQGVKSNALVLPAFNESGQTVDLLFFCAQGNTAVLENLKEPPEGLLAPKVAAAYAEIVVTTSLPVAARMFAVGIRNVMLMRGVEDAQANAPRLKASGVRLIRVAVRKSAEALALRDIFTAAGIAAELLPLPKTQEAISAALLEPGQSNGKARSKGKEKPLAGPVPLSIPASDPDQARTLAQAPANLPAPIPVESHAASPGIVQAPLDPLKPVLLSHDPRMQRARFKAGSVLYEVETALDCGARLEIRVEHEGRVHLDRFDLSKEAQRKRFAQSSALKTAVPVEYLEAHLIHLLDAVREIQETMLNPAKRTAPRVEISEPDRLDALALLRRADLLDAIAADLEALGWTGEERNKRLLFLVALSRKLPKPLSGAPISPAGLGKSHGLEILAEATPPEDLVHVTKLTDSALLHQHDALRHKLLLIDEADALTPEVQLTLRVLQSRGSLSHSHVTRDPVTGETVTRFSETQGPVAVLTSTTRQLEEQILSRCFNLAVDDSPEQTARILEIQRRLRADPAFLAPNGKKEKLLARLRTAQRVLEVRPVLIPFAERIEFPSQSPKYRREQDRFLNLIEASALLHQYQRLKDGAFIVADERDFQLALELAQEHIARASDELSVHARDVLALVRGTQLTRFSLNELHILKTTWTRHKLYTGLEELSRLEVLASTKGRGKVRRYELQPGAAASLETPIVRLRTNTTHRGELSKLSEGADNNFAPVAATG